MRHVLTSEAVTRGHPDKLCDQVADGVLDALLTEDPEARAACEAAVWENHLLLFGEISARQEPDYGAVVREVAAGHWLRPSRTGTGRGAL